MIFNPFRVELYQNPEHLFSAISRGVPLLHNNTLQYSFMKIGIFTGVTSVRSKNIFTDISRYPTGKHEIN